MSQATQLLESLKPGIEAGAQAEPAPTLIPQFLQPKAEQGSAVSTASDTERLVREVLARARPTVEASGPTPSELANTEYHQLRIDNMVLADELRAALIERDVAVGEALQLRETLVSVSARADKHVSGLAALRAEVLVAGRIIVDLISKVDGQLDTAPAAVQAFRPKAAQLP